jgi:hypothetical protein
MQLRKSLLRGFSIIAALSAAVYVTAGYNYSWQQTGSDGGYGTSVTLSNGRTYVSFVDQGPLVYLQNYTCGWSSVTSNYHDHFSAGPFGTYSNLNYWDSGIYYQGRILIQDVNSSSGYGEAGVYNL